MDDVAVHLIDIHEHRALLSHYRNLLSLQEAVRADAFRDECDRTRYICMHGVLREQLAPRMGTGAGDVVFTENEYGKPGVAGGPEFNISYSGNMGIVVITSGPVGVDVERVDPDKVAPEMVEEVFSPAERSAYFDVPSCDIVEAFFKGWVRKESFIKAIGMGVSFPLRELNSRLDRDSFITAHGGADWRTRDLTLPIPGYTAALTIQ
jgi:4'-phosphopantetheinyl transferase